MLRRNLLRLAALLGSFTLTVSGTGSVKWNGGDGSWTDAAKWSGSGINPNVTVAVNDRGSVTFDHGDVAMSRLDVGDRAGDRGAITMNSGSLAAAEFIRLGEVAGSGGAFVLNGGRVCTTELAIGGMNTREETSPPCEAEFEIRGGSVVAKYLAMGYQGGSHARLHIVGSKPECFVLLTSLNCSIVNGPVGATCELAFDIDADGVTPIELRNSHEMPRLSCKDCAGKCLLRVSLLDEPPGGDITLIRALRPSMGTFHELPEGSAVRAEHAGRIFEWRLTYRGGGSKCDVVLTAPQIVSGETRTPYVTARTARVVKAGPSTIKAAWENLHRHIDAAQPPLGSGTLAFPGAEGFGAYAKGGRGGRVIFVTNLNDSGPGSLREAISAKGPRTVLFRVGGVIELKTPLQIREPFITIAGQTAPGDGICLRGAQDTLTLNNTHDVIVRCLRVRTGFTGTGEAHEGDCISCYSAQNFILDHCSTSWGTDETLSCTQTCDRYTVQWCIVAEGLDYHRHSMGSILAGDRSTWHHNLYAHCGTRNPRFAGLCRCDFRNNVIYDWRDAAGYGEFRALNYAGNFLKPGPSTKAKRPRFILGESYVLPGALFASGNVTDGFPEISRDNRSGTGFDAEAFAENAHDFPPIKTQSASEAASLVFASAGAIVPKRDAVDARIVAEAREGKGRIIRYESEVGGCPKYAGGEAPLDLDNDGIPDDWEKVHGLNPNDPADTNAVGADGYTNLERYLNSLVPAEPKTPQ